MDTVDLYMSRMRKATRASILAENPKFREFWKNVAHDLNEIMIKKFG